MDKEWLDWLEIAESDLKSAIVLLNNIDILPCISIYHSHQCIEKLLKALLLKNDIQIPKIHNLNILLKMTLDFIPEIQASENKITVLNSLMPLLRYPTGDTLTKEEAKESIIVANTVFDIVKKYFC